MRLCKDHIQRRPRSSAIPFWLVAIAMAATPAFAIDSTPTPVADQPAPAAPTASSAPAAAPVPAWPAVAAPLTPNQKPMSYDGGALLGKVYITGAVTGLGQWQDNVSAGDLSHRTDLSNGQIFLNKTAGLFQYFIQVGAYSLPDLGLPYINSGTVTNSFFGPVPQWFVKLAPTANFSIEAGKLPTLIGAEYTFSFENMNIERGLLWNQENAVNRGVQVNYTAGPVTFAASWNDGFYSNKYSWAWLSATWAVTKADTVALIGSVNTRHTSVATAAAPLYQNNEQLYNLIYTHISGRWTIEPYLQYTRVPRIPEIGALEQSSTLGVALLANYAFSHPSGVNLPVRVEYISSTGSPAQGAPNLLYGPGSKAWSVTLTPTYQYGIFFVRAELSYVSASSTTAGLAFGPNGTDNSQTRALLEVGALF